MNEFVDTPELYTDQFPGPEYTALIHTFEKLEKAGAFRSLNSRIRKGTEVYMWEPMHPERKERQFRTYSHIDVIAHHIYFAEKEILRQIPLLYNSQRDWRFIGTEKIL